MKITMKKLGRGLAAGLTAVGEIEQKKKSEAEEQARYEAEAARQERALRLQEAESAQRQEENRLKNLMKKAQWKNQQMMQAAAGSNYDPATMAKAWNQFGNNSGTHWTYNAMDSAAAGPGVIIYDVGTKEQHSDGTDKMGPDGKPITLKLPGSIGQQRFDNQDDHVNFFLRAADPAWALAHDQANVTAAQTRAKAQKVHDQRLESDPVYRAKWATDKELAALNIKKKKADIEHTRAQTGLAKQELEKGVATKPQTSFTGIGGNTIPQSDKDADKAKAFAAAVNKMGDATISSNDAARMMQLKDDPKAQAIVEQDLTKLSDGSMTEAEFRKRYKSARLPKYFIDEMIASADVPVEEGRSFWDKFVSRLPFVD